MKSNLKSLLYLTFVLFLANCSTTNSHDQYLIEINNVTNNSCATGYEYNFSTLGNNVSIVCSNIYADPIVYTAALSDLYFSWNTLNVSDEEGPDHEIIIACSQLGDSCLQSESGGMSRITIEIKGEEGTQRLLSNLSYLKNLNE